MANVIVLCLITNVAAHYTVPAKESGINAPVHVKTNDKPVEWGQGEHTPLKHDMYASTTSSVYYSHPVTLIKGEAWFSLPDITPLPMPNPGVPYAIIGMAYDIVDDTNRSVPISELYMHHWLVYDTPTTGSGFNIGCGGEGTFVSNVYGAGAEMRGIDYAYTPGHGYVSKTGKQFWSANLHFINTEDLSSDYFNGSHGAAVKSCIECEYVPGKSPACRPGLDGSAIFGCCAADARCPVNNPQDITKKNYYLKTKLVWTTDIEKITHVRMAVIDGIQCHTLTNLYPNMKKHGTECGDKVCTSQVTRPSPFSGTLYWAYDHQHVGAINGSLAVNGVHKCTSLPHTGTDAHNTPGNELGYVVGFEECVSPHRPESWIHIKKGDNLTLTGYYSIDPLDNTSFPLPGGSRTGVMHLFYFFFSEDVPETMYACNNNACVPSATGVPLAVCQAACGGHDATNEPIHL